MRILLIEDHRDIAANIAEYFGAKGDSVALAADGESGLKMAHDQVFDIIVLDLMLPGIDGLSVCRQLRSNASHTPILMLTAKDLLSDKIAGFEAGADDYLVKPFSLLELSARLGALLRRSQQSAPTSTSPPLVVGDLTFDSNTLDAVRGGQPIKLNPTTRRILMLLMQNTHRVVPREELERALWGSNAPSGDLLRAHMHALRNALDKNFPTKLLHTVHGTGYRLAVLDEGGA
jgi:DNA-binding response OmpR family regulator